MSRGRVVLGGLLFVLSLLPYALIPAVPFLGWPLGSAASAVGILVVGAEVAGALAILLLGHEAVAALRRRLVRRRSKAASCRS